MNENTKVLNQLSSVGILITDIYDLVNSSKAYPEAIPILLNFLKNDISNDSLREGIIRALAVKEAKGIANEVLLTEYHKIPKKKNFLRWAIGNTMEVIIEARDIDKVISIIKDNNNGTSREMFVLALGKIKTHQAEEALIEVLNDEELTLFAIKALAKLKSTKAKHKILQLIDHKNILIRKEAIKFQNKIDR